MMESDVPVNAPKSCPGSSSLVAGKANSCDGCPNQKSCASGSGGQLDSFIATQISSRLENIKNIILVLSGKGGVGKSSVASCLAYALNSIHHDERVAVFDIDITGPSIPTMFGCDNQEVHKSASGWSPAYINENLSVMSVGFMLASPDQAIIWKGPRKHKLIEKMLSDVNWVEGDDRPIDYLIIDTPPGTTDEHMSIVQFIKAANALNRTKAIIVTTPQEISLSDVRKQIGFCEKVSLPIAGVVGNMVSYNCTQCHFEFDVFPSTTGGVVSLCEQYKLNLLGMLPLDSGITWCLDQGISPFDIDDSWDNLKKPSDFCLTAIELMVGNLIIQLKE